jgi:hypothetical protein
MFLHVRELNYEFLVNTILPIKKHITKNRRWKFSEIRKLCGGGNKSGRNKKHHQKP